MAKPGTWKYNIQQALNRVENELITRPLNARNNERIRNLRNMYLGTQKQASYWDSVVGKLADRKYYRETGNVAKY
jgi:hypothetical protein